MNTIWNDILVWCAKYSAVIIGISTGLMAKISYEVYMKRTLTIMQWFAIMGLSIFVGYMVSLYCSNNDLNTEAQFLVPISTLLGEKIIVYIFENHQRIFGTLLKLITPKKNEGEK